MRKMIGLALALVFVLSGCGYRFAGGGSLPSGVTTIHVAEVVDHAGEPVFAGRLTDELVFVLVRSGKDRIAPAGKADARLVAMVRSVSNSSASRVDDNEDIERRVTVVGDFLLEDRDGRVVWERSGLRESEAYGVSASKSATEGNRDEALEALSRRLAERMLSAMTDRF